MCLPFPNLDKRTLEKGEHAGYRYQIVHNDMGYRCGYVRVEPGHPWFGKGYEDLEASAHGGLTFAATGSACAEHGADAEWWVGFDCGHWGDAPDPLLPTPNLLRETRDKINALHPLPAGYEVVRDQDYARRECFLLCEQAAKA